ncbi:hypothetical protein Clacol_005989 [Clathrus columnatus]|uniref:DNA helicase n=1 Tax=Clathrus columnatus TaxID=1419009 RepID=A0AAV5AGY8_9AGAM|nr:hypothetical protein Clacol_005989 [Clathrus columnatus]
MIAQDGYQEDLRLIWLNVISSSDECIPELGIPSAKDNATLQIHKLHGRAGTRCISGPIVITARNPRTTSLVERSDEAIMMEPDP